MENSLRFAAVDIGSNAVRLMFAYVFETDFGPIFKKASLTSHSIGRIFLSQQKYTGR